MAKRKKAEKRKIRRLSKKSDKQGTILGVLADDSFSLAFKDAKNLFLTIKKIKTTQLKSVPMNERIKQFVKDYFRILRPEISDYGTETDQLDQLMQKLMKLANSYTSISVYKKILSAICKQFGDIEVSREYIESNLLANAKLSKKTGINDIQNSMVISTLENAVPSAAISYKQAIGDLEESRLSYRGTVAELREVLREVLDYLAPDNEVKSEPGFKFEEGKTQPTMKQKVRFILKHRKKSATAIEAPEEAAGIVDEGIAKLVRATYDQGSLLTHTHGDGRNDALQIKRYLDSVLCELLEIHD